MRQRSPFIVRERTKRNVSEPRGICLNHILNTSTILLKQSLEKETIRHMNIYKFIYIGIRMKKKPKLFDVKNTHLMYLGCFQFFVFALIQLLHDRYQKNKNCRMIGVIFFYRTICWCYEWLYILCILALIAPFPISKCIKNGYSKIYFT